MKTLNILFLESQAVDENYTLGSRSLDNNSHLFALLSNSHVSNVNQKKGGAYIIDDNQHLRYCSQIGKSGLSIKAY